jgi:hypothetical protein
MNTSRLELASPFSHGKPLSVPVVSGSKSEQVPVPRLRRCIRCLPLIQLRQIPVESFRFDHRLRLCFVCRLEISARRIRRSTNLPEAGIMLELTLKTVGQC